MIVEILHDRDTIYEVLKSDIENQIFCIGDLDDFFWSKTVCYCLKIDEQIKSVAVFYIGYEIPTLLLFENENLNFGQILFEKLLTKLPQRFFAHLSLKVFENVKTESIVENYGSSLKMTLRKKIPIQECKNIRRLRLSDIQTVIDFLKVSYPTNWFDPRMILTGKYFGYYEQNQIVGISGVHVFSSEYKVAALGNIATHPDFRGLNIATKLVKFLCHDLQEEIDVIGLNVRKENRAAINCYSKIGFEISGEYEEFLMENIKKKSLNC